LPVRQLGIGLEPSIWDLNNALQPLLKRGFPKLAPLVDKLAGRIIIWYVYAQAAEWTWRGAPIDLWGLNLDLNPLTLVGLWDKDSIGTDINHVWEQLTTGPTYTGRRYDWQRG
jgi:hypothetical protein